MKKALISLLSALMTIVMVFALTACNGTDDKTTETKATETSTQAQTEQETEKATQTATEASDNNTDSNNENTSDSNDELVVPTVTGTWKHENYPQGCSIEVTAQDGNTITFTIYAIRGQGAQIASCDKTVTLTPEYVGSEVRGYAEFDYTDSFLNSGLCKISVAENVITLVVEQEVDGGGGWSMAHATGDYIFAG